MAFPTRAQWQAARDGAGLKQGYTKASMGDLIDKFNAIVPQQGEKMPRVAKLMVAINKQGVKDQLLAIAVDCYVAAEEYLDKLEKENKLGGVARNQTIVIGAMPPIAKAIAVLANMSKNAATVAIDGHKEDLIVKRRPQAKDHLKDLVQKRDAKYLSRAGWQKHRDDAGLPAHYIDASVGDLLERVGKLKLQSPKKEDQKELNDVLSALAIAAVQYYEKLKKDGKIGKPKVDQVVKDLKEFAQRALEHVDDFGDPETFLAALQKANVKWSELVLKA
jgi:hypothetical protein